MYIVASQYHTVRIAITEFGENIPLLIPSLFCAESFSRLYIALASAGGW